MTCTADAFIDTECSHRCIRPIESPKQLVWGYYQVAGKPQGTLDERKFLQCKCGCGNLQARPPVNVNVHPLITLIKLSDEWVSAASAASADDELDLPPIGKPSNA